jgi:hypothetical protein
LRGGDTLNFWSASHSTKYDVIGESLSTENFHVHSPLDSLQQALLGPVSRAARKGWFALPDQKYHVEYQG